MQGPRHSIRNFTLMWAAVGVMAAHAGSVEMTVDPNVIRLGDSAVCKIIFRDMDQAPAPSLPQLSGFDVVPMGTEQSFQFINGQRQSQIAYTFRLTPQAAGDFQIGPFRLDHRGDAYTIPAVQLQVLPHTATGTGGQASQLDDMMFATLTPSRPAVYVNERFELILSLYAVAGVNMDRQVSLQDFDTSGLSLEGFEELAASREALNGQIYDVRKFRSRASALTAGSFTLQPRLRVNLIVSRGRERMRDPFFGDSLFESMFARVETRPHTIQTRPLRLEVKNLPEEGRPASFAGAVGAFSFDLAANPLRGRVGEPITLAMRIQGRGNLEMISAPRLELGDTFRTYDPQLVRQDPGAGFKEFEQVVIPRSQVAELPAVSFTFFNPETERYETLVKGPFALDLQQASAEAPRVLQPAGESSVRTQVPLGSDLVYLKATPRRWSRADGQPASRLQAAPPIVHVLPALALLAAAAVARQRDHRLRNPHETERQQAPRRARKGLARTRELLAAGRTAEAAQVLSDLLHDYFGHVLALPPGEVTADKVGARLKTAGVAPERVDALRETFALCDRIRYSGTESPPELRTEMERRVFDLAALLRESGRALK